MRRGLHRFRANPLFMIQHKYLLDIAIYLLYNYLEYVIYKLEINDLKINLEGII